MKLFGIVNTVFRVTEIIKGIANIAANGIMDFANYYGHQIRSNYSNYSYRPFHSRRFSSYFEDDNRYYERTVNDTNRVVTEINQMAYDRCTACPVKNIAEAAGLVPPGTLPEFSAPIVPPTLTNMHDEAIRNLNNSRMMNPMNQPMYFNGMNVPYGYADTPVSYPQPFQYPMMNQFPRPSMPTNPMYTNGAWGPSIGMGYATSPQYLPGFEKQIEPVWITKPQFQIRPPMERITQEPPKIISGNQYQTVDFNPVSEKVNWDVKCNSTCPNHCVKDTFKVYDGNVDWHTLKELDGHIGNVKYWGNVTLKNCQNDTTGSSSINKAQSPFTEPRHHFVNDFNGSPFSYGNRRTNRSQEKLETRRIPVASMENGNCPSNRGLDVPYGYGSPNHMGMNTSPLWGI